MRTDASVVVPSFGGARRLPTLLDAFVAQQITVDMTWEVIVVADGVVDDSLEVLRNYESRLPLQVVTLRQNRGRSAALNAGFAVAQGRVLVRCDDDLTPTPEFVARHVAHHSGPAVGVVGLCPNIATETHYDRVYGRASGVRSIQHGYSAAADRRWQLWAANCSVMRETYDLVGPYDEVFREYGWEDIDWGYRLHQARIPIQVAEDLEVPHRGVPMTAQERIDRAFASGCARARFESKHGSPQLDTGSVDLSEGAAVWAWNKAVHSGSRLRGARRWHRIGTVVDCTLPVLPRQLGQKLIALAVESAGAAGGQNRQRHPK
ncbi:MAG: glycosyltransferase family A protein [Actinomycetes bacterium]